MIIKFTFKQEVVFDTDHPDHKAVLDDFPGKTNKDKAILAAEEYFSQNFDMDSFKMEMEIEK